MIEICLKYDNMHIFGIIDAFNCINNHVISCINSMLSQIHFDGEAVETTLAISSLSSGRPTGSIQGSSYPPRPDRKKETSIIVEQESDLEDEEEQVTAEPNPDKYKPHVPYPQALNLPKDKTNETDDNLLDAFKKVTMTIPLIDAIKHIPSYAKFLKGICTPHRNPRRIQLSETVSSIMLNALPIKKRDPGAPIITSKIGGMSFTRSLLDTGASISILPKGVFDRHHVGELQHFFVELCLADGSVRKPHELVEDVIVRIEDYYFSVDFLVVDMKMTKELSQALIILGRPFLSTVKAVTDWGKGEVILKVGEHTVKVDINKLMKYPSRASEDLGAINFADDQDIDACVEEVMMIDEELRFEELPMDEPSLELKTLSSILKYAFLDEEKAKPMIISSKLDIKQEEKLLEVLRNEEAIGLTLTDLKGLDPSLCTHRIFLEDESRPIREAQGRLNPKVWEAVKEEIIKWLNPKIIYPISDSQWVSPVHVVPKKARVTVMMNEKGEEI